MKIERFGNRSISSLFIVFCSFFGISNLLLGSVNTKWQSWALSLVQIILVIIWFLPNFKKYSLLIFVLSIYIFGNITTHIEGLLSKDLESYASCLEGMLMWSGAFISVMTFISLKVRKWLVMVVIALSLGSLFLFPYFFPSQSVSFKLFPLFLLTTIINIIVIILIFINENQEKEKEMEQIKQSQTQAKLSSLKDQLSPHFLFNTLNTITSISQEQTVKDFVDEVANIYRYVLQYKEVDSVTIRQEIEFINSYLFILKSRLEGGIDFYVNINSERIMDTNIPPLTLQMLVENAVKHNITSIDNPLNINIFMVDGPLLVIQNNYQPKISVLPTNQTGLKNIAERYRLLYKKEIIVENKNGFFTVKLPIVLA